MKKGSLPKFTGDYICTASDRPAYAGTVHRVLYSVADAAAEGARAGPRQTRHARSRGRVREECVRDKFSGCCCSACPTADTLANGRRTMLHWRAHLHPNTVAAPANILAIIRTTILTSGTRLLFIIVVCYSNKTGTTATAVYIVAPSDDPLHRLHRSSTAADSEATNAAAGIHAGTRSRMGTSGSGHEARSC